jgi:Na+/H+ antiporter NhaC
MIPLPTGFIDNLISTMGGVFTDLLPLVLFIAGILIALFITENWIDFLSSMNVIRKPEDKK